MARLGKGAINDVTYSPDGKLLAVASEIGIWLYDVHSGQELNLITGHTDWVLSVSFSLDGQTIASGSWDNTIRLWDVQTGVEKQQLIGHTGGVHSVSFSPDGQPLASGSWDGTVLLWRVIPTDDVTFQHKGDVNGDGTVNIQDLISVAAKLGQTDTSSADVNGDGVVNIQDLVLVAVALGTSAAAPSLHPQALEMLTATEVKQWLSTAQQLDLTDTTLQRGILFLEQLLIALTPKETALLANYPNPFNPETWIPYHLAKNADVTLHIYAVNGMLVRTLALGHQAAGVYQNRSRAAYWDGRNALREKVASGLYFYRLTAGDFSATHKMLIRK